jgi:hypothetical protein
MSGKQMQCIAATVLLFFILSHPVTYALTNQLVGGTTLVNKPTTFGLLLHSTIFAGGVYYLHK